MEDSLFRFLSTYRKLPVCLQSLIGNCYNRIPFSVRYGAFYPEYRRRIQAFEQAAGRGPAAVRQLQWELLAKNVNAAIADIPFYQRFAPIADWHDFEQLPVVGKQDYLARRDDFCRRGDRALFLESNTGGSSGTPMTFYLEKNRTRPKEYSHFHWFWGWWGFRPGAKVLMVRGKALAHNALVDRDPLKNCLNISCYELNKTNAAIAVAAIRKFQPEFIHAYPSALNNLMKCVGGGARDAFGSIRGIFLGSEYLYEDQRLQIEQFFHAPVCSWYGHSECAVLGGYLPGRHDFAFFPFYGYLELLDDAGNPVSTVGQSGRMVATSFDNGVMPFVRYDTGDRGTLGAPAEFHGIPMMTLQKIDGREQDVIYLNDGTAVPLTAFIFGQHLEQFSKLLELQLEQSKPGELLLRVVPLEPLGGPELAKLKDFLENSVSRKLKITVEPVEKLAKTVRGKHRFLIQHIAG